MCRAKISLLSSRAPLFFSFFWLRFCLFAGLLHGFNHAEGISRGVIPVEPASYYCHDNYIVAKCTEEDTNPTIYLDKITLPSGLIINGKIGQIRRPQIEKQIKNACWLHAIGRASLIRECISFHKKSYKPMANQLLNINFISQCAAEISLENECSQITNLAPILKEMLEKHGKTPLLKSLQIIVKKALNGGFVSKGLKKECYFRLLQKDVKKTTLQDRKKIASFRNRCLGLSNKIPQHCRKKFREKIEEFCKHVTNVVFLSQETRGEWTLAHVGPLCLHKLIQSCNVLKNLRGAGAASPYNLADDVSIITLPEAWVQKFTDDDFNAMTSDQAHFLNNCQRFRDGQPQIIIFQDKDIEEEEIGIKGHWMTILATQNAKTDKLDIHYFESAGWPTAFRKLTAITYMLAEIPF